MIFQRNGENKSSYFSLSNTQNIKYIENEREKIIRVQPLELLLLVHEH